MNKEGFNISRWSIDHPHILAAFYLAMLILAVVSIGYTLPRRFMPYVESPMLGVVSMMPGLSAEEMETYISKPIEERMVNVPGVRYIRSTSQDGFSIVSLEFPYGSDMKASLASVQSLLNVIQADLPVTGANLKPSWVLPIDPLNLPILSLSLSGDSRWSLAELRQLADNEVVNRLKSSNPNVLAVGAFGGYRRQLQIIADRQKLSAQGLSILQLRDSLDRHNVARPAGTLTDSNREAIVRLNHLADSPRSVENYVVKADGDRVVYVKDVARVVDTFAERRSAYHHYEAGKVNKAIEVNVLQNPSASSPQVIAGIRRELQRLERDFPGIHFQVSYDNSRFVGILMSNMLEELLIGVLLTGLVVLLFLGDWRGTLISMVTIPTSLAMAILCMIPLGLTLNSSTLIGLLISIGRLVDDSIIDIHAIERHLKMGKSAREATIAGITEVRLAVAASTLMLILALSPLLVCGGIVQLMFVGLVLPLILGLLASFFVSLTLTAVLAARILADEETRKREHRHSFYRYLLLPVQRALDRLELGYERLIGWLLVHRFANLMRVLITLVIGFGFYYFIGSEMMPLADVGQGYMVLEMEPGTSFAATEKAVEKLENIMARHPELRQASLELGTEPMTLPNFSGYAVGLTNGATGMLTFSDMSQRQRTIWQVMDAIQREATQEIAGIRRLQIKEMGSDVMASSAAPIQLLVYGPELETLSNLAEKVADIARQEPGMHQVSTSWVLGNPDWEIQVDPRRAAEVGLSPDEVSTQVYYSLRGGFANEFYRLPNRRQAQILVRYEEQQRRPTPDDLGQLLIQTPKAGSVPLSTLATFHLRKAPTLIEHDGMRRVVSVMGYYRMSGPYSMDLAMFVMMKAMSKLNWPPGYGLEVRGDMTQMMDSFARLLAGLEFAMLFIFLVLVAQFRGFMQPAQMVFSIPLELSGVFLALWLQQQAFSTVSIMAVIVLTGMDATTAILLIDQILRYRSQGMPRNLAIRKACPTRLRPILMTSLITIVVMFPVAFFPKTGMDAYSPMGTVILGGLIMGTLLSLIDIPIMHSLVDDGQRWLAIHVLKKDPTTLTPVE
ncbi:efflux RND transporter permease subunit [bacterium]|nr:efflux RND transporter permease subunit [bacterium]